MNKLRVVFLLALTVMLPEPGIGLNITSAVGRVYSNVAVKDVMPDGIRFSHASGAGFLAFRDLPESIQNQYGYDPAAEAEHVLKREREARMAKAIGAVRRAGFQADVKIFQITGAGALASGTYSKRVEYEETEYKTITRTVGLAAPGRPGTINERFPVRTVKKVRYERYSLGDTIFVIGVPEHLVDGDSYKTPLFPCGRFQYVNTLGVQKTVPQYATSPEEALLHLGP